MKLIISLLTIVVLLFQIDFIYAKPFSFITLQSGPSNDLGFNNMINQGRIGVAKAMEIEDSRFYVVDGYNDTYALLLSLIPNEEISLVICSSQGHTSACKDIATLYVNNTSIKTNFLVRGSGATTPNLSQFSYNYASINYVSGMFAGLQTKNNKIGFLSPGQLARNNDSFVFAFWLGAKTINPNVEFLYYNTGAYLNADIGTAATKDLISRGCDVIADTLDDFSVGNELISRDMPAMGTNGFPQRELYGENVIYSYTYNWTKLFLPVAQSIKAGNASAKWYADFNADPEVNFFNLDYGFQVLQSTKDKINTELQKLISTPRALHPYYCNDYLLDYGLPFVQGTTNCVAHVDFLKINKPVPGMEFLGNYVIELTEVEFSHTIELGFSIVTGILVFIVILMMVGIARYKETPSIRSASPIFLNFILMGGILVFIGIIVWVSPISTSQCNGRFWLVSLGFSILIGSLVVKNVRIWLIFDNPELKAVSIKNYQLYPWVGLCILINIILMSILTSRSVGNLIAIDAFDIDNLGKYEFMTICKMNSSGASTLYTLLAYFAALLLVGVFVSWKIRIVDIEEFNESKAIANTLYAISFCLFVIVPLMISPQDKQSETIILCAAALFITVAALAIVFVPKFYRVFKYGKEGTNEMFTKSKSASSVATARAESSKSSNSASGNNTIKTTRRGKIISPNDFSDDTESTISEPKPVVSVTSIKVDAGAVLAEFTDDTHSEFDENEFDEQQQEQQEQQQENNGDNQL